MNRYNFILNPPKPKMTMKKSSLLNFTEEAFIHGIAVKGAFRSALGKDIATKYEKMVLADALLKSEYNNKVYGRFSTSSVGRNKRGYNIYIGRDYDKEPKKFDYKNLSKSLRLVADDLRARGITSVAVPKIGVRFSSNRADWERVKDILYDFMDYGKISVTVYSLAETKWQPKKK